MILSFGKHYGETCDWVLENDPAYAAWVMRTESENEWFLEAKEEFKRLQSHSQKQAQEQQRRKLPWWDVLEVTPNDAPEQVKKAYRRMISLYHPDKVNTLGRELIELANRKTQEINTAWEESQK